MNHIPRIILTAALAPAAYSQVPLHTFSGDSTGDRLGWSVAIAGDVDADGFDDLIVGASFGNYARVYSGATGNIIHEFTGPHPSAFFGRSVAGAGDVNADGYDDLIVGAHWDDTSSDNAGSATVFSGLDGAVLYSFFGNTHDQYGWVGGAGDANGDGYADFVVGAIFEGITGSARVYSGIDGSVLFTEYGTTSSAFGFRVGCAGDVNADGFDDVIVGSHGTLSRVLSGVDGSVLYEMPFGRNVGGAGDVNADGHADFIVGFDNKHARVFSGLDGTLLHSFDVGGGNEGGVSGAGDVDGDGYDDLLVGVRGAGFWVFSGQLGSALYAVAGPQSFAFSVGGPGDVNGDGFPDFIIGDVEDQNPDGPGYAVVYSSRIDCDSNGVPDDDEPFVDCNGNGAFDGCDISSGTSYDCNENGIPDECEGFPDCNGNGIPDACDIADGTSQDCTQNGIPDECDPDCNSNGVPDLCETADGSAQDLNGNGIPDECEPIGSNYCVATPNSTGIPAVVSAIGSSVVADNGLTLVGAALPQNEYGYFLTSQSTAFVPNFGGSDGNLCLGAPQYRFNMPSGGGQILNSGASGSVSFTLDMNLLPQGITFDPGETWFFQLWFRDFTTGPTSNTTDGLEVLFR